MCVGVGGVRAFAHMRARAIVPVIAPACVVIRTVVCVVIVPACVVVCVVICVVTYLGMSALLDQEVEFGAELVLDP